MSEDDEFSTFLEFEIERSLFDDIRLGSYHDDVSIFFTPILDFFPESRTYGYFIISHKTF